MESQPSPDKHFRWHRKLIGGIACAVLIAGGTTGAIIASENHSGHSTPPAKSSSQKAEAARTEPKSERTKNRERPREPLPFHQNITATMFWIGEPGDKDNGYITNTSSAWVQHWSKEFGGTDSPTHRCAQYTPCGFTPQENWFYVALPFNDLKGDTPKSISTLQQIPWFRGSPAPPGQSLVKNRWVQIVSGDKSVYAQWEDAGPYGEDDGAYVFGYQQPKSPENDHAGIDLSPAATDYLGLNGEEKVKWRFVEEFQVPNGPWKQVITRSGVNFQ